MEPNNPPCWTKHRSDEMFYSLKCVQNATTILLRRDATSSVSSPRWETLSWVCFACLVSAGHVRQASQPSLRASLTVSFRRGEQRLCSECLLDIRARYPLCKDEPRHPSEENCSCLWSYCRSGTALSCGRSWVIPTWCFHPRRQQFQEYGNNDGKLLCTRHDHHSQGLYAISSTSRKAIKHTICWSFQTPGELHHTDHGAQGKYHLTAQSDQKCQGEIYLQLLGGCFDLHSSSRGVLLRSSSLLWLAAPWSAALVRFS